MFGKFLGILNQKSSLPKNQIEVACPLCGAVQREPRQVVTTLCRSCGEHLRIAKNSVIASSKINPVPSSVYSADQEDSIATQKNLEVTAIMQDPLLSVIENDLAGISSGTSRYAMVNRSTPAKSAAPQSTLNKMKEQGGHGQHHFKKVECFDCHNLFRVGRSAKSTNCPACGVYICLENFEITLNSTTPIRTRGDVLIRRNGNLSTTEIHCRNLTVHGRISGNIDCTGEFIISTGGKHIGSVRCDHMVIEKGSEIHFLNTIEANEVDVRGQIFGNIQCSGPVLITATGRVNGDVTAHSVSIQPGGQIDGAMNILRSGPPKQPPSTNHPQSPAQDASTLAVGRHD